MAGFAFTGEIVAQNRAVELGGNENAGGSRKITERLLGWLRGWGIWFLDGSFFIFTYKTKIVVE